MRLNSIKQGKRVVCSVVCRTLDKGLRARAALLAGKLRDHSDTSLSRFHRFATA